MSRAPARHRIDVRGNPIARTPLFPTVRFALIGVLMFAGVFTATYRVAPDLPPADNATVTTLASTATCGAIR